MHKKRARTASRIEHAKAAKSGVQTSALLRAKCPARRELREEFRANPIPAIVTVLPPLPTVLPPAPTVYTPNPLTGV